MNRFIAAVTALAAVLIAAIAIAAFAPPIGTAVSALFVAGATAAFAGFVVRRYVRPLEQLADTIVPPDDRNRPAAELAAAVASEHRAALERLSAAAGQGRRREAALAYTTDAVLIVLPDGQVEYANPTARMFLQDRVLEVTNKLNQPDLEQVIQRANRTGQAVAEDVTLWVPGAKPARARAVPLADGATVLLLSDLSESYRLDRVRRDFVANVSHELKTPVAAIRALAETAATAMQSDDHVTAVRFVERLGTESARLAGLVTDLLDLSRVEAGGELFWSMVDLDALLVEAADRGRVVGEVKEIEIVVHETDIHVEADASQLAMAVKNLVDNAVRYSEGGKVELAADQIGDLVRITVADQGLGIPSDELSRIFERFYRVDKGRSRATGGTGLGLAIVRHVVENHGGQVAVESELGVGSTFTITLPVTPDPARHGSAA
jgi:two-component system, OmpR family, sensor histidine kinase SenX3